MSGLMNILNKGKVMNVYSEYLEVAELEQQFEDLLADRNCGYCGTRISGSDCQYCGEVIDEKTFMSQVSQEGFERCSTPFGNPKTKSIGVRN